MFFFTNIVIANELLAQYNDCNRAFVILLQRIFIMNKEEAIKKIKKCLALGQSPEPEEAAAALRQAQKLANKFNIQNYEMLNSVEVSEHWTRSNTKTAPKLYESELAYVISMVFGCKLLFSRRPGSTMEDGDGGYLFVGVAPGPEVAAYTFKVLMRQLTNARAEYAADYLKRYSANKLHAKDLFSLGWVLAIRNNVSLTLGSEFKEAINIYMQKYNDAPVSQSRDRSNSVACLSRHFKNGHIQGRDVRIFRGVAHSMKV